MKARRSAGHVQFVSSITALQPFATQGPYATSKAALVNFAKVLQLELNGTSIGVSVICSGIVATQMRTNAIQARPDALRERDGMASILATQMGMSAEHVGRMAIAGMRAGQFYIFSHTKYQALIAADQARVLAAMQTQADRITVSRSSCLISWRTDQATEYLVCEGGYRCRPFEAAASPMGSRPSPTER